MDVTWLCVVLFVAVVIAVVLLVVTCVNCRKKGPMASITQTASDEYVPSPHFRVIHPFVAQPTTDPNSLRPPVSHPSPFPNRADGGTVWQPSPYHPSETESNPSYENPGIGPESLESDADEAGSGYIIVIPEGQDPVTNRSGASTPSSDVQNDHDYVNVANEASTDYLNVDSMYNQRPISATTATTDSDDDDDDDETGNYVNQQPMIHS